jgi:hypothetical protein
MDSRPWNKAKLQVKGNTELSDCEWNFPATDEHRFFKVEVEL